MANPQIPAGPLSLLETSITLDSFPSLNVTPPYLGKQMVRLAFEGEATRHLPVAVGVVPSPQVYLIATLTIDLVKSLPLASQYKAQMESASFLGDVVVRPDTTVFPAFDLSQVAIADWREMAFSGEEPSVFVTLRGQYAINSSLWP